jgi:hypothetical protein
MKTDKPQTVCATVDKYGNAINARATVIESSIY